MNVVKDLVKTYGMSKVLGDLLEFIDEVNAENPHEANRREIAYLALLRSDLRTARSNYQKRYDKHTK